MQCVRNNATYDWKKTDNNAPGMTVSMTSSIELSTTSYKAGVLPLFDQETFTNNMRGGRNKTVGRHSATARFIKGDRKVIKYICNVSI